MTGTEWFLVIVVVILVPLAIAVAVTLWTLEQARLRNKRNRPNRPIGVKRKATRELAPGEVRRRRVDAGEAAPDAAGHEPSRTASDMADHGPIRAATGDQPTEDVSRET